MLKAFVKSAKEEYVSRSEYYDWSIVIPTALIGTTICLVPLIPIGYSLDQNDFRKKTKTKDTKWLYESYVPAILGSLVVGVGLNSVSVSNRSNQQYR